MRFNKSSWIKILTLICSYAFWIATLRMIVLSILTYFLIPASPRLQEISEVLSANELGMAAFSAGIFASMMLSVYPLTSTPVSGFFQPRRFEKFFIRGWIQGSLISLAFCLAMLVAGYYKYVGFLIQVDEGFIVIAGVLLKSLAIIVMVYCEEFIFRSRLLGRLTGVMSEWSAIFLTAIAYSSIKLLQFDLGWMQWGTLFIISILLGLRAVKYNDFLNGAGFWSAILIVYHAFLGLPIFGNEFTGMLLLKYQGEVEDSFFYYLTGGLGGPLSSSAFQTLIVIHIAFIMLPQLNPQAKSLK